MLLRLFFIVRLKFQKRITKYLKGTVGHIGELKFVSRSESQILEAQRTEIC